ncbi:hypothetical protein C7N43_21765 [Sphingobacteriales bacterium UPWRP_1]|nr:hypothetical protein BVG80_16180 [Sphingobacteriales bacterium TSM_CSM]PSJ74860.1 hypothetical protein C7N43_21765 [Sphingobacteriales bacterium UPWRP_1]
MTAQELTELQTQLQNGNEAGLDRVFLQAHPVCVAQLQKLTGSAADAEDLFMDAMWAFRQQLLRGKTLLATNLNGYLFTIARNLWLKQQKQPAKPVAVWADDRQMAPLLEKLAGAMQEQEEFELPGMTEQERRIAAVLRAFDALGEQCRKLLQGYLIDEIALKDLQVLLGYANYDTIRAAKYQCKKALIDKFNRLMR